MVYAIDFDGTIVTDKFPEIGEEIPGRINKLKHLQERGDKIILWTCRNGDMIAPAVEWCKERGLVFDAVNENLPEVKERWGGDTRKVYCDFYVDDKNLHTQFLDL